VQITPTRKYLVFNKLDLLKFHGAFIEKLERKVSIFKQLEKGEIALKDLYNLERVKLHYKGYLPYDDVTAHAMKNGVVKAKFDKFAYDEIYRLSASYFKVLIKSLKKLIFFLGHELNMAKTQQALITNQQEENEYLKLIKDGNLKELFSQLANDEAYKNNPELLILSSKFNLLEKRNRIGLVAIDDYDRLISKILYSLIELVTQK